MPIGDLLSQISGGSGPAPTRVVASSGPSKRKADGEPASRPVKSPRISPPRTFSSTSSRPITSQRPYSGTSGKPVSKPAAQPVSAPAASSNKPPKKGSFAEILARAQKAQATMGQVGKIQHKKVEGGSIKRAKEEVRERELQRRGGAGSSRPRKPVSKSSSSSYSGTSKPSAARPSSAASKPGRPVSSGKRAPPPEPEKKIKKAATATIGYTGTARPIPGKPSKKTAAQRGGALLNATSRHGASSRDRDEYDEELDDFIEYDDEGGDRYGYASDGSSDMEAGMDDIDGEERQAERMARLEDVREKKVEERLRAEKEERRRAHERRR